MLYQLIVKRPDPLLWKAD